MLNPLISNFRETAYYMHLLIFAPNPRPNAILQNVRT